MPPYKAYHIIGFTSAELGAATFKPTSDKIAAAKEAARQRFEAIKSAGKISARCYLPRTGWNEVGRSHWQDDLAGDDRYVFLSVGERYGDQLHEASYGFVFDAMELLKTGHVILGVGDLMAEYDELLGEIFEEVAATLPRLPMISDEELQEFADKMGEHDPAMLAHIKENSTNPEHNLAQAVALGETVFNGYHEVVRLFKERVTIIHAQYRLTGEAAIQTLLAGEHNFEILVTDYLPLTWAIGEIKPPTVSPWHEQIEFGRGAWQ